MATADPGAGVVAAVEPEDAAEFADDAAGWAAEGREAGCDGAFGRLSTVEGTKGARSPPARATGVSPEAAGG